MRHLVFIFMLLAPTITLADPGYNPYPDPSCAHGSAAPVEGVKFICGNESLHADHMARIPLHYKYPHVAKFCGFLFDGERPGGKAFVQLEPKHTGPFDVVGEIYGGPEVGSSAHQHVWLRWIDTEKSDPKAVRKFECEYGGYNGWHMHRFRKWN